MAKAIDEKVAEIAYLRSSNFLRTWNVRHGRGCDIEGVALSMARAAPRLLYGIEREADVEPRQRVLSSKRKSADPYANFLHAALDATEAVGRFASWLKTPASASRKKTLSLPAEPLKIPPFDLQDVPKAMRKLGMPMAAKLQERWFAGKANYSNSPDDLRNEINQDGASYAPDMVDQTTVKMEWVLSFSRAKAAFDKLIATQVSSPIAVNALKKILSPYRNRRQISCWSLAHSDFLEFHRKFQFQLTAVNAAWGQRISEFLNREVAAGGVPDDLTGALGAFNFYAAANYVSFEESGSIAVVTDAAVYVRDNYDFSNDQYLGHWNSSHVAVVPAQQLIGGSGWFQYPIADGRSPGKDGVLYPVINKDYREWRRNHGQGGDFIIYTDRVNVKLSPPLRIIL
jgi:hypothetical protein